MKYAILAFIAVLILNVVKSLYFSQFGAGGGPKGGAELLDFLLRAAVGALMISVIIWLIMKGTALPAIVKLGLVILVGMLLIRDFGPFQVWMSHMQGQPGARLLNDLLSSGANLAIVLIVVGIIFMGMRKLF